jgi:hypothetical protein
MSPADIHPSAVIAGLDPAIHLHGKKDGPAGDEQGATDFIGDML